MQESQAPSRGPWQEAPRASGHGRDDMVPR